jgi:hypothetical protein
MEDDMKYFSLLLLSFTILSARQQDEVTLLKWVGPEGSRPGTYEEWIAKHPCTPFATVLDRVAHGALGRGTVAVLTEQGIAGALAPEITQLVDNLQGEGYTVLSYAVAGGTPDTLRSFLRNLYNTNGIEGALFVGNLPVCWFEIKNDFNTYGYTQFPCDLFYMDLDGTWLDTMTTGNGIYDGHTGAVEPEIYVGRLTPTGIGTDTVLLKNYFHKDNSFRRDTLFNNPQAMVFVDDDWIPWGPQWAQNVALLYPDTLDFWDAETTRASVYRPKLDNPRAWVSLFAHSSPSLHQFTYNSGGSHDYYYASEYTSQNPPVNFYNFFACSFARYTDNGYGGGRAVFDQSFGVGAVGSTKTGSMLDFEYFYQPLADRKDLGAAFKDWFSYIVSGGVTFDELCWHYGMTLLADPYLKPTGHTGAVVENRGQPAAKPVVLLRENPVRERVRFTLNADRPARVSAALFDIQGRKVMELMPVRAVAAPVYVDRPLTDNTGRDLPAGIYIIRAEVDGTGYRQKIVKLE